MELDERKENIEKVFYNSGNYTITNRRIESRLIPNPVKILYNVITSNPNHKTFDASSVKSIKDVVSPSYWLRVFGFSIVFTLPFIFLALSVLNKPSANFNAFVFATLSFDEKIQTLDPYSYFPPEYIFYHSANLFNSKELIQIKEHLLNYGIAEEVLFYWFQGILLLLILFLFAKLFDVFSNFRYTLISFKDGSEIKINEMNLRGSSGKVLVKSWLEAVSFGIIKNNTQEPLLIFNDLIISTPSFSIMPGNKLPSKAFNLTAIKAIKNAPYDIHPTLGKNYHNRVTIELNDGQLFTIDGEGWNNGNIGVKKALEKAIKN